MLRVADPTLVVLVGPPASGKSAWAGEHFSADQVVSSDRLRAMVGEGEHDLAATADAFAVLDQVVASRVRRGLTTVVDTLGLDADRRRTWRELAARHGMPCVAVAFDTPPAECRRRNTARGRPVPPKVLSGQLVAYAEVRTGLAEEGFADVLAPEPVRLVPPAIAAAAGPGARTRPRRQAAPTSTPDVPSGSDASNASNEPAAPDGSDSSPASRSHDAGGTVGRAAPLLRFGLQLSSFGVPGGPAGLGPRLREAAAAAEDAGFSSLWVMDHMRQAPQLGRVWDDMLESTTALGYLAAATRTASVGCLVHGITYRNIAHLGKIVATLDVLSGGRACCGLGAAWYEAEHLAYGWPFPPVAERFAMLEDALRLLPLLWGPGSPAFEGQRVRVPEAMCYPRPLRRPPILVGGGGERRTLRLVAEYADACNLRGDTDTVRHKLDVLAGHCADVGRDPATVEVTHLSTVLVARDPAELDAQVAARRPARGGAAWARQVTPGTVEDHVLRAEALAAAGVQHVIVSLAGIWEYPAIERFAEVIDAFR